MTTHQSTTIPRIHKMACIFVAKVSLTSFCLLIFLWNHLNQISHVSTPPRTFGQQSNIHSAMCFTLPYSFTRFILTSYPQRNISAETIFKSTLQEWIGFFGCPSLINKDRGSQFPFMLIDKFTELLEVKHITTTAYYPCTNGLIERFHR